jgi:hypothetical protein
MRRALVSSESLYANPVRAQRSGFGAALAMNEE